jgi:hypothetical protein
MSYYILNNGDQSMSKKKSYMDSKVVLSEGFFSKLFGILNLNKSDENKLKKDKKVVNNLAKLNLAQSELEDALKAYTGDTVDLGRYSLKDFI